MTRDDLVLLWLLSCSSFLDLLLKSWAAMLLFDGRRLGIVTVAVPLILVSAAFARRAGICSTFLFDVVLNELFERICCSFD